MKHSRLILLSFMLFGALALWGCPKKSEVTASPESQPEKIAAPSTQVPAAAETKAPEAKQEEVKSETSKETAGAVSAGLQPIYFDFDRSFIRDDARSVMKANAEWLKANPKARIRIEGNCDERGTIEYNQALGQRRAASAKKYLADLGISGKRVSLISYGKEKPICTASTEECWQKNRRDDLVVQSQ